MKCKKRVMFVGTGSGCGKTTITCALMKALGQAGEQVVPFKCGPDYIDPMFHRHITGVPSTNLDSFFLDKEALCWLMNRRLPEDSFGIVEGVMGAFDGLGMSVRGSSFEIALWTQTPMVLIVNARGMSMSVAALVSGFVQFAESLGGKGLIQGVILNQVSQSTCEFLRPQLEARTGLKVLGYFPKQEEGGLKSRHLGLVTAAEVEDLDERMNVLAKTAASSIDLNGIRAIASSAGSLPQLWPSFMEAIQSFAGNKALPMEAPESGENAKKGAQKHQRQVLRLAIAMDKAFCFYYNENLELLNMLGVELKPFSPLAEPLPEGICGLYLGGGYPELFARELSLNRGLLESIKQACANGLPVIAECGGFMYLHEMLEGFKMAGVIPGKAYMTKKLGPFGYIEVRSKAQSVFGPENTSFLGHEFHYSRSDNCGGSFIVSKANGRCWEEGFSSPSMYAGYPHLYFYSNVQAVIHFVQAMRDFESGAGQAAALSHTGGKMR